MHGGVPGSQVLYVQDPSSYHEPMVLSCSLALFRSREVLTPSHTFSHAFLVSPLSGTSCGFPRSHVRSRHLPLFRVTSAESTVLCRLGIGEPLTPPRFLRLRPVAHSVARRTQGTAKTPNLARFLPGSRACTVLLFGTGRSSQQRRGL